MMEMLKYFIKILYAMKFLYFLLPFFFFSCTDVESVTDYCGIYSLEYFDNDLYLESSDTLYIYAGGTYEHVLSSSINRKRIKVNFGKWELEEGHLLLNDYIYLEPDYEFPPFTIDFNAKVNIWGEIKHIKQRTTLLEGIKYIKHPPR